VALDSTKATFDKAMSALRWLATTGLRTLMSFWYQKQPVFWIPQGLVPYYAEWLLSFPRAPVGSISIQAWQLACGSIILLVSDAIIALIGLAVRAMAKPAKQAKGESMKMAGEKSTGTKTGASKKEL
jgi:hypothetical protein